MKNLNDGDFALSKDGTQLAIYRDEKDNKNNSYIIFGPSDIEFGNINETDFRKISKEEIVDFFSKFLLNN